MKIVDISVAVDEKTILWPGNKKPRLKSLSKIKNKKGHNETSLEMNMHTGTHIDAPLHFLPKGHSVDKIDLDTCVGSAFVADLSHVREITADVLEKLKLPKSTSRILFKTSNSALWQKKKRTFLKGYVGITPDAAEWLVRNGVRLVGIDYLSVAKFTDAVHVHDILLKRNVVILEGTNLCNVEEGTYELVCVPLKISNAEGAPTRAILIKR